MVSTIQSFALSTGDPNVYNLAEIPAPQPSSAAPPPGTPESLRVELLQNGALKLGWKCNNPDGTQGTIYEVKRQTAGQAEAAWIGSTGVREFVDDTLSMDASPVQYEITAVRSTKRGNPANFTVKFGTGGVLMVSASGPSVSSTSGSTQNSVKLAA